MSKRRGPRSQRTGIQRRDHVIGMVVVALAILLSAESSARASDWTFLEPIPTPRIYTATAAFEGKIYVLGGTVFVAGGSPGGNKTSARRFVEIYDVAMDSWTTGPLMQSARSYFPAVALNGKIYAFGGSGNGNTNSGSDETATVEVYDPNNGAAGWTYVTPMPAPRAGHAAAVIGGKVYVVGGERVNSDVNTLWEFDPNGGSGCPAEPDTDCGSWSVKTPMPTARVHPGADAAGSKMYVIGGYRRAATSAQSLNEVYDPVTDSWTTASSMSIPRWYAPVAELDGFLYVIGGLAPSAAPPGGSFTDLVERYDPALDEWSFVESLPLELGNFSDSAAAFGGAIFLFSGNEEAGPSNYTDHTLRYQSCYDNDDDGFGDPGVESCPGGPHTDCDDSSDQVFPGAVEDCNGIDDNCDGQTDEGFDQDGDAVADCFDNCVSTPNTDQTDSDLDGFGDECDTCPLDPFNDADKDGVCGEVDVCTNTVIPESVPTLGLQTNRWALVDGDTIFDTTPSQGNGPQRSYDTTETAGCSCKQIIAEQSLGQGHTKHGCSVSAMDDWVALVNR